MRGAERGDSWRIVRGYCVCCGCWCCWRGDAKISSVGLQVSADDEFVTFQVTENVIRKYKRWAGALRGRSTREQQQQEQFTFYTQTQNQ